MIEQFRMSVLLSNEENSDLLNRRSPTVTRSASNKDKKNVSRNSSNRERDCVKYINEKSASNVSSTSLRNSMKKNYFLILFFGNQDLDDDSEAEKLSPLLITDDRSISKNAAEDLIDDTDDVRRN